MRSDQKIWQLIDKVNEVILGKQQFVFEVIAAFLAGGNVLLEDIPGVGKTTMALALSKVFGMEWNRVQFTPDVLPSDLTGFSIYQKEEGRFVYQPGAVFCNLLLADEINRTSPKTQSALLEVMEEKQVTVDGETRPLPRPFHVIATQNPTGTAGTQLLPPAQMDRFLISLSMGYPDPHSEILLAKQVSVGKRTDQLRPIVSTEELENIQEEINDLFIHDAIYQYIVELVGKTRNHPLIELGASPRATIALVKFTRAVAWLNGFEFVQPSDVVDHFIPIVSHRVVLSHKAQMEGISKKEVLQRILADIPKPALRRMT